MAGPFLNIKYMEQRVIVGLATTTWAQKRGRKDRLYYII